MHDAAVMTNESLARIPLLFGPSPTIMDLNDLSSISTVLGKVIFFTSIPSSFP